MLKKILSVFVATSAAIALYACSTTVKMTAGDGTPLIGGLDVELDFKAGDPATASVTPTSTLPEGTCVKITFTDANGRPIGGGEATAGGPSIPVPDGTEGVLVSPCDPKPEEKDKKTKMLDGWDCSRQFLAGPGGDVFLYRHMPLDWRSGRGWFVDFAVRSLDHDTADTTAFRFLQRGPAFPRDPSVLVLSNVYVQVASDATVTCSVLSESVPTSLWFDWNGRRVAQSLLDAKIGVRNGWYVTSVTIPSLLVDVSPLGDVSNDLAYKLSTRDGDLALDVGVTVQL